MHVFRIARRSLVLAGLALAIAHPSFSQSSGISVRLTNPLSTESARAGDTFSATLDQPLMQNGRVIAPKNASVNGVVREAVSSGRLKRPAEITLQLNSVQSGGRSYAIDAAELTIKAGSHTTRNLVIIGGSAGAGALIGGVTAGGKGALIGSAAGAGAGTLAAYLTGKKEIELPTETLLTFEGASVAANQRDWSRSPRSNAGDSYRENDRDRESRAARDDRDRDDSEYRGNHKRNRRVSDDNDQGDDDRDYRRSSRDSVPVFSRSERGMIVDWFSSSRSNLPPGLAKRDRLPPGLEKQLRERGTLPPGLQKRAEPLPYDLERRLPRLPTGYRRSVVAGNVILMDERTGVIADIIRDVLR